MNCRVGVYYPLMPHYRQAILEALHASAGADFVFHTGDLEKQGIRGVSGDLAADLIVHGTRSLGGLLSWDPGTFRQFTARDRFDVVLLAPAVTSLSVWSILVARRFLGRPTMLWGQCGKTDDRSLKRWAQELLNRLSSGVLVYGRSEAAAACELGLSPEKVRVVGNSTFSSSGGDLVWSQKRLSRGSRLQLLFAGRLVPGKNVEVLLAAVDCLNACGIPSSVVVIGDGEDRRKLEDFAQTRSVPAVFHGEVYDRDRLSELFRAADLVVAPGEVGLLAIDALLYARPLVYRVSPRNGPEVEALTPGVNCWPSCGSDATQLAADLQAAITAFQAVDDDCMTAARASGLARWSAEAVAARIVRGVLDPRW